MAASEELRLLSIFHGVLAGLAALFGLFPLVYVAMGTLMLRDGLRGPHPPPPFVAWMMIGMGIAFFTVALAYVVALAMAARCIARRRRWTYVIVVAAISCAFFPLGTTLGVFTILALSRPEVKALFQAQATMPVPAASPQL